MIIVIINISISPFHQLPLRPSTVFLFCRTCSPFDLRHLCCSPSINFGEGKYCILGMNSSMQNGKTRAKSGNQMQSLFFRDLATPVSSLHKGRYVSPGQAAAVSALWRDNFGGSDPPPPPIFSLNDQPLEFSPKSSSDHSPPLKVDNTPTEPLPPSAMKSRNDEASTVQFPTTFTQQQRHSPPSGVWWTPMKAGSPSIRSNAFNLTPTTATNSAIGVSDESHMGCGTTVLDAVVPQPGALILLPQPREVARPDIERSALVSADLGEETWLTVYGFSPEDTNVVLREFEKCGTIMRHVTGPVNANWMHILYQTKFDAQKALSKNGAQINGLLIVGVKPLDPNLHQYLDEKMGNRKGSGFLLPPPPSGEALGPSVLRASSHPLHFQKVRDPTHSSVSAIASPAKSTVSKIMDLMFGV